MHHGIWVALRHGLAKPANGIEAGFRNASSPELERPGKKMLGPWMAFFGAFLDCSRDVTGYGSRKAAEGATRCPVVVEKPEIATFAAHFTTTGRRKVSGNIGEAAELVLQMQTEIGELTANAPDASGLSYFHELDNTLYSVTSSTFIGAVYALFGLENVADPADADGAAFGYPQLSDEYLVDADPDIIFLADTICCGQSAETVAERAGWDQLSAVQNGTVIELNDDIVSRWGPRLVDFIEEIALAVESATVPA